MKTLYCIICCDSDEQCGNREIELLHTTNKKRLEDLCKEFNHKLRKDPYAPSFSVREIEPVEHITKEHIKDVKERLSYFGIDNL